MPRTSCPTAAHEPFEPQVALAQEANHRIAEQLRALDGHVQNQIAQLERRGSTLPRAEVLFLLKGIAARIMALGRHHRLLAEEPQGANVELCEYLVETCSLTLSHLGFGDRLRFAYRLESGCSVSPVTAHSLALALSEIVMNAAKYAHPAGLPVLLTVACSPGEGGIVVEISDDGVGLPDGFDSEHIAGMGFRIIRRLALRMQAELAIESDSLGLTFRFTVPVA